MSTLEDYIINQLPHGSGINGDWQIGAELGCNNDLIIIASNYYETMDEQGSYRESVDFTATYSTIVNDKNELVLCLEELDLSIDGSTIDDYIEDSYEEDQDSSHLLDLDDYLFQTLDI